MLELAKAWFLQRGGEKKGGGLFPTELPCLVFLLSIIYLYLLIYSDVYLDLQEGIWYFCRHLVEVIIFCAVTPTTPVFHALAVRRTSHLKTANPPLWCLVFWQIFILIKCPHIGLVTKLFWSQTYLYHKNKVSIVKWSCINIVSFPPPISERQIISRQVNVILNSFEDIFAHMSFLEVLPNRGRIRKKI